MSKYKNKIQIGIIVCILLIATFFHDSGAPDHELPNNMVAETLAPTDNNEVAEASPEQETDQTLDKSEEAKQEDAAKQDEASDKAKETDKPVATDATQEASKVTETEKKEDQTQEATSTNKQTKETASKENAGASAAPEETTSPGPTPSMQVPTEKLTCTISINCSTILNNISKLDPDKVSLVPKDGVILAEQKVTFKQGENVFDVLQKVTKDNKIHMEFMTTPLYHTAYIEGIGNLYEFDCGELSGWQYKVNGNFPSFGCSNYTLANGDKIEWVYTCDLGKDVGGYQELSEE